MSLKCFFGFHKYVFVGHKVFAKISNKTGLKFGEVELNLFACECCNKNFISVGKSTTYTEYKTNSNN